MKNKQQPTEEKIYEFESGIYPRKFCVYFGRNAEFITRSFDPITDMTETAQLKDVETWFDAAGITTRAHQSTTDLKCILMCFPMTDKFDFLENLRTFVHEAIHACDVLFQDLGLVAQDFDEGNEAYVYLTEWIFANIYESYLKYKDEYKTSRK